MLVRSPTLTKRLSSVMVNGSSPDSRIAGAIVASSRTRPAVDGLRDGGDVVGGRAAAAADEVDEPASANSPTMAGGLVGRLVVLAEGVGQPGVGVARDERVGETGHLGDVGPHLLGAERAVEARRRAATTWRIESQKASVDLAGQGAAGRVGDGAGDDDGPAPALLLEERLDGEDRRLGVERVEDRLDEDEVAAAVDEPAGRLEVGRDELVVGDVARAGVVDVGRDRGRTRRRPERAGDVARPVGRRAPSSRRPRGGPARPPRS